MVVDYVGLGKRIAACRRSKKLTQAKLSEMAEIGEKFLSDIEHARSIPSLETVIKIMYSLDTSFEYLFWDINSTSETSIENVMIGKLQLIKDNPLKTNLLLGYIDMLISLDCNLNK